MAPVTLDASPTMHSRLVQLSPHTPPWLSRRPGALCCARPMSNQLVQPYARESSYKGIVTPADIHRWVATEHTEAEWQARERVLLDQHGDAADEAAKRQRLAGLGFWVAIYAAIVSVLALSLTHRTVVEGAGPVWAVIVGVVAAMAAFAGFAAAWLGLADWHGYRVHERVATRALREFHIGYGERRTGDYPQSMPPDGDIMPSGISNPADPS